MRGESSTSIQRSRHSRRTLLSLLLSPLGAACLLLSGTTSGCDPYGPGYYSGPNGPGGFVSGDGRLALAWTLNSVPLTEASCKTEGIDYMNVFVLSTIDGNSHAEFSNVACALDRYSLAMVPTGDVRIYVDAVRLTQGRECVRYSGRATASATTAFPQTATPVVLRQTASCP